MRKGWLQHSQSAIFIVVFGSDQIRVSVQRHHTQWNWTFGTSLFGSGAVPWQGVSSSLRFLMLAVVCPSKSASQRGRSTTKSCIWKKGRWEKGWRRPALSCDYSKTGDYSKFSGGALSFPPPHMHSSLCLRGSPERQSSFSTFPVGIQHSQQNPWTLLGHCQQLSSLFPCRLQWHDVVFIEARLDFFFF